MWPQCDENGMTPLMRAINDGNLAQVKQCIEFDDNVDQETFPKSDVSILRYAIECARYGWYVDSDRIKNIESIVEYLLEKTKDINQVNSIGENLLFPAINNVNEKIVGLLIQKGINVNQVAVYKDGQRNAPHNFACVKKYNLRNMAANSIYELLVKNGANDDALTMNYDQNEKALESKSKISGSEDDLSQHSTSSSESEDYDFQAMDEQVIHEEFQAI